MSVVAMASAAVARRDEFAPQGRTPRSMGEIAEFASDAANPSTTVTNAMSAIAAYIPTEVLTLYVAVVAALGSDVSDTARWVAFAFFVVLTPCAVWVIFAIKVKSGGQPVPLPPGQWPLWEMAAGLVAFVAWAVALPGTPFAELSWYSSALAGVIVLVATTLLGLVAPLFQNPLPSGTAPSGTT